MKPVKRPSPVGLLLITFLGLTLIACNNTNNKFPIDEKRARQHIIPLKQADAFRNSFKEGRKEIGALLGDSFLVKKFEMPDAEMFNKDAIALLLNQEGVDGVRIYLGRDDSGKVRLVLLPVDKNGKDIRKMLLTDRTVSIPGISSAYAQQDGDAIETGQRCPTMCDDK